MDMDGLKVGINVDIQRTDGKLDWITSRLVVRHVSMFSIHLSLLFSPLFSRRVAMLNHQIGHDIHYFAKPQPKSVCHSEVVHIYYSYQVECLGNWQLICLPISTVAQQILM